MALVFKDRVKVTSTTTGTGTLTLGSAVSGFQDFSVIGNGNTTYYTITDQSGNWEVGVGTYTSSGTTLSRDTILESSNGGTAIDFSAGTKTVFVTYPAEKSVIQDASGNVTLQGVLTPSGGISNGATFNKTGSGGEGGELHLEKGATSTLSGDVVVDAYNQSVRIFENGGTNRGAQLDLSSQAAGVGSTILTTANTVAIANGGTGQITASAAFNALSPITTAGDLILGNGSNSATRLAIGASNTVLTSNGSTASWVAPSTGSSTKSWTGYTASDTYTVPTGVSSIRAYAFGAGGNGGTGTQRGGGGGGCAFGDIAVTAGQTVTISISSGVATVSYGGTTLLTANKGTDGGSGTGGAGGSATKHASVTNGGAYTGGAGGTGGNSGAGGGSSGSPLGNGYAGGQQYGAGGGGAGGAGSSGSGGGGGGAGGAGSVSGGGAGGAAGGAPKYYQPGIGRSQANLFADPLMQQCISCGGAGLQLVSGAASIIVGESAGAGGGGGGVVSKTDSTTAVGGAGGIFGGGGGAYTSVSSANNKSVGGDGGFGGGGGGGGVEGTSSGYGGNGGYGGGGGAGKTEGGAGGGAVVLIYA